MGSPVHTVKNSSQGVAQRFKSASAPKGDSANASAMATPSAEMAELRSRLDRHQATSRLPDGRG